MATQPQFDDSERKPEKMENAAKTPAADSHPLSLDDLDTLRQFLLLLDEWDKRNRSGGVQ